VSRVVPIEVVDQLVRTWALTCRNGEEMTTRPDPDRITSPWRTRNGVIVAASMAILVVALAAAAIARPAGNDSVSVAAVAVALVALTSAVTFAYRQDIADQRERATTPGQGT
jgi:uncharacterized protein involved in exopolysaccharide biosynthesis